MVLRFLGFLLVFTVLVGGTHLFLYKRLVRDTVQRPGLRRFGAVALAVLALTMIAGPVMLRVAPGPVANALLGVAYVWMGLWFMTFSLLLVPELGRGMAALVAKVRARFGSEGGAQVSAPALPLELALEESAAGSLSGSGDSGVSGEPPPDFDPERRLLLSRAVAGTAVLAAGGLGGYGAWRAYAAPEVTEIPIRLRGLPRALDGFSIVQLTDIHVGNLIERKFMDELVFRANGLKPDLVAITGDLVDGSVRDLGPAVAALGNLRAPYGRYFVAGNHEYYSGDEAWVAFLQTIGIPTLRNRHVRVGDEGASFDLIGVDDWNERGNPRGYDLEKAVQGRDPDRAGVLLAHQPANFREATREGIGLQLSGHTHGGQIFPFTLMVGLQWEYRAGLYTHEDASIYVSRGCGFWGPPMRVGAPPELVKIVLTA